MPRSRADASLCGKREASTGSGGGGREGQRNEPVRANEQQKCWSTERTIPSRRLTSASMARARSHVNAGSHSRSVRLPWIESRAALRAPPCVKSSAEPAARGSSSPSNPRPCESARARACWSSVKQRLGMEPRAATSTPVGVFPGTGPYWPKRPSDEKLARGGGMHGAAVNPRPVSRSWHRATNRARHATSSRAVNNSA